MLLAVGALLVPVGLAARMLPGGVGDVSGGLLFAGLVYVLCALAAPRVPAIVLGVVTAVIGLGVELLQLTPFPGTIAEAVPAARYVLGATFVASDIVVAVVGAALAAFVDSRLRRPRVRSTPSRQAAGR